MLRLGWSNITIKKILNLTQKTCISHPRGAGSLQFFAHYIHEVSQSDKDSLLMCVSVIRATEEGNVAQSTRTL